MLTDAGPGDRGRIGRDRRRQNFNQVMRDVSHIASRNELVSKLGGIQVGQQVGVARVDIRIFRIE